MKIAYLIICHKDPEHITRLAKKLVSNNQNHVYIHVDAKCKFEDFFNPLADIRQVFFIQNRIDIQWGGFSSVVATINLMKAAVDNGHYNRFVLLQGLEYPIKSNFEIEKFFENNREKEFILAQDITHSKNWHEIHKYRLFWNLDVDTIIYKIIRKINYLFLKIHIIPHFKRNYTFNCDGMKMYIYQGCAQFGLTEEAVRYIIDFYDRNTAFNKYFASMYAPDEAYFHTIIYNSKYIHNTPWGKAMTQHHITDFENLTYFEYPDQITTFKDVSDWPKLKSSGYLFFRKASSESKALLDLIDKEHLFFE